MSSNLMKFPNPGPHTNPRKLHFYGRANFQPETSSPNIQNQLRKRSLKAEASLRNLN